MVVVPNFSRSFGAVLAFALALALVSPIVSAVSIASIDPAVSSALSDHASVRVLVVLKNASAQSKTGARPLGVASVFPIRALESTAGIQVTHRYASFPFLAATVDSNGLAALQSDPTVAGIYYDHPVHAMDNASNAQIHANSVQNFVFNGQNVTGRNQTICIIDTGIDFRDPAFGACGGVGVGSNCRVVGGFDFANGDTNPLDDNGHGTHVAGIASANGSGLTGVSPGANIVAIKVLDANGAGFNADVLAGIDWCTSNRSAYNITVISMSLGDNTNASGTCDADFASDATSVNAAVSAGLFVTVASGNNFNKTGIASPGCLSNSFAVGAVNSTDSPTSFSQDWANLLVYAPGSSINSTTVGNNTQTLFGTSMATPHVAGVVALLQDYAQRGNGSLASVSYLRSLLNRSGVAVNDTGSNRVHYRVDALAAFQAFQADVSPRSMALVSFTNASTAGVNYSFVNVTFVDDNRTPSACILQWSNGTVTNLTMAVVSGSCSFNVTAQSNGSDSMRVFINDSFTNVGSAFFTRTFDLVPPQNVTSAFVNNSVLANTSVLINVTFSDSNPDSCILQLDNSNYTANGSTGSCLFNRTVGEGIHNFTAFANDTFGLMNQSQVWFNFTTDLTAPAALSFVTPTSGDAAYSRNNSIFVNLSFTELHPFACVLTFNATTNASMTLFGTNGVGPYCSFNVSGLNEGVHNYTVFLNDSAGLGNATTLRTFIFDQTAPSVTAVTRSAAYVNRTSAFVISANATDALSSMLNLSVGFQNASGTVLWLQPGTLSATANYSLAFANLATLADGNYTLNVTATDNATNAASNASVNLTVDGTAPSAPALSVTANASGFVFLNWSAAIDAVGLDHYGVVRNGTTVNTTVSGLNFSDSSVLFGSSYNYSIAALDAAGNAVFSNAIETVSNDTAFPVQSANVTATNLANGSVNVSWLNVTSDVLGQNERNVSFQVYRTTNTSSTNVSNMTLLGSVNALSYEDDSALSAATSYLYVVASVDGNANVNSTVFANNSINHSSVTTCTNDFSAFSACSGGSQSKTRICLGQTQTQSQSCTVVSSGGGGSSGGSGGSSGGGSSGGSSGSSSPSTGGARGGGGGGGGSSSNLLFVVENIPQSLKLVPGQSTSVPATVSSFYTGYLRVNDINISGVPSEWYDLPDLSLVSPISKTNFSIHWHPPADARGNYSVRLDISGVGTRNAGLLNTSFNFTLVLPPANAVRSSGDARTQKTTPAQGSVPMVSFVPVMPAQTGNDSGLLVGGVILAVGLLAIGYPRWNSGFHGRVDAPVDKTASMGKTGVLGPKETAKNAMPRMDERAETPADLPRKK